MLAIALLTGERHGVEIVLLVIAVLNVRTACRSFLEVMINGKHPSKVANPIATLLHVCASNRVCLCFLAAVLFLILVMYLITQLLYAS